MNWATLFERAPADVTVKTIQTALATHREHTADHRDAAGNDQETGSGSGSRGGPDDDTEPISAPLEPSPARVVADADVLAADLLVGADARRALEPIWQHSWMTLIASDSLLDDAHAVIETCSDAALAADWREHIESWREPVGQPAGDQPALASAYRGGAMHILSFAEQLTTSQAGASLNDRFPVSVRQPSAFGLLFDPESLYQTVSDGSYSGPDRGPRNETSRQTNSHS